MKLGLLLTGTVALILGIALVVGALLPKTWEASAQATVDVPEATVREALATPSAWSDWTPWPEGGASFSGPSSGAGATRSWDDEMYGTGSFTVTEAREGRVAYEVSVEEGRVMIHGSVDLTAVGDQTEVTWTERGDFGRNPLLALVSRRMPEQQSEALRESLGALSAALGGR